MAQPIHTVTFNDGSASHTLEPPDWHDMSQEWTPVPISSMFEAWSGAATKITNSGASQKWSLAITVSGLCEPNLEALDQSLVWTVTVINRDSTAAAQAYTMWCLGPPEQTINNLTGQRAWVVRFRQQ